jgi:hypothetical protein
MRGKSNVIKRNVEKVWGARYTLGARYLPKNTVLYTFILVNYKSTLGQLPRKSKKKTLRSMQVLRKVIYIYLVYRPRQVALI